MCLEGLEPELCLTSSYFLSLSRDSCRGAAGNELWKQSEISSSDLGVEATTSSWANLIQTYTNCYAELSQIGASNSSNIHIEDRQERLQRALSAEWWQRAFLSARGARYRQIQNIWNGWSVWTILNPWFGYCKWFAIPLESHQPHQPHQHRLQLMMEPCSMSSLFVWLCRSYFSVPSTFPECCLIRRKGQRFWMERGKLSLASWFLHGRTLLISLQILWESSEEDAHQKTKGTKRTLLVPTSFALVPNSWFLIRLPPASTWMLGFNLSAKWNPALLRFQGVIRRRRSKYVQRWNEELEKALWAPRHNCSEDEEIRFSVS